jgi:nicotinamidase-related amidase
MKSIERRLVEEEDGRMKPALLVVDVQKEYFKISPVTAQSLEQAIQHINYAISLFREKGLPVVCIQNIEEEAGVVPGAEGFETPDKLQIVPSDPHIHKTYGNAFNKTSLERDLKGLGVDTVIVTGFCAEYCVLSTCRGAEDVDLTPIVLQRSLASADPENIRFVESISDVVSSGALKKFLG